MLPWFCFDYIMRWGVIIIQVDLPVFAYHVFKPLSNFVAQKSISKNLFKLHGWLQPLFCHLVFIQVCILTKMPTPFSEGLAKITFPGVPSVSSPCLCSVSGKRTDVKALCQLENLVYYHEQQTATNTAINWVFYHEITKSRLIILKWDKCECGCPVQDLGQGRHFLNGWTIRF